MAIDVTAFDTAFKAYLDNSDWEEGPDIAKARAFITACRKLLAFPILTGNNSVTTQFNRDHVQKEMEKARAVVNSDKTAAGGGMSRQFSFEEGWR